MYSEGASCKGRGQRRWGRIELESRFLRRDCIKISCTSPKRRSCSLFLTVKTVNDVLCGNGILRRNGDRRRRSFRNRKRSWHGYVPRRYGIRSQSNSGYGLLPSGIPPPDSCEYGPLQSGSPLQNRYGCGLPLSGIRLWDRNQMRLLLLQH